MKMVILAGGQKSTISDEPEGMPKPMISIGGRPLLWHIMKHASMCGIKEFIICGGYKVDTIKDYFLDFYIYQSDIKVDLGNNSVEILKHNTEDWSVSVVDTGISALPTERIRSILDIAGDEFIVTYGDCLSDISLGDMIKKHAESSSDMTVAVAIPTGRKIPLHFESEGNTDNKVWTSAGTFIVNKDSFIKTKGNGDIEDVLDEMDISVYKHQGFYNTIETLRDKKAAENMWENGNAPWMGIK